MRVAAIDCGTNSIRLLIADAAESTPEDEAATPVLTEVLRRTEVVRLGQGVDLGGAQAHDGELGGDEEAVEQDQEQGEQNETEVGEVDGSGKTRGGVHEGSNWPGIARGWSFATLNASIQRTRCTTCAAAKWQVKVLPLPGTLLISRLPR